MCDLYNVHVFLKILYLLPKVCLTMYTEYNVCCMILYSEPQSLICLI